MDENLEIRVETEQELAAISITTSGDTNASSSDESSTDNLDIEDAGTLVPQTTKEAVLAKGWKVTLWPILRHKVIHSKDGGFKREVVIIPEAFRMWFYIGFMIFLIIAVSVSLIWSELDTDDNPILNRFGNNNLCIYFDYPPFSTFAITLWLPQVFTLLAWEWFDHARVYGDYKAQKISSKSYYAYTACTIFESLANCFFAQALATSPMENMYMHVTPWIMFVFALWTIAFKRILYMRNRDWMKTGRCDHSKILSFYIVLLAIAAIIKNGLNMANLFWQAELWKRHGLEWTSSLATWNDRLYVLLVIVCPVVFYFRNSKHLPTVKLIQVI